MMENIFYSKPQVIYSCEGRYTDKKFKLGMSRDWNYTDSNGCYHCFVGEKLPTMDHKKRVVPKCSCPYCECDEDGEYYWVCKTCGEELPEPSYKHDIVEFLIDDKVTTKENWLANNTFTWIGGSG